MFRSGRPSKFPPTDRFQFLRLMKSIEELAVARGDGQLEAATQACIDGLIQGNPNCSLSRIFAADYATTGLSPDLAFIRCEALYHRRTANAGELLQLLFDRVKLQASSCKDEKYLECVEDCERVINSGDPKCPFHASGSTVQKDTQPQPGSV
jgi:hypothetical protein